MSLRVAVFGVVFLTSMVSSAQVSCAQQPDWQKHLDWSSGNYTTDPGQANCQADYLATYPACLTGGGRACLMTKAIASAKANDCANALRVSLITQCHNGGAQSQIGGAGADAVCNYLKTK
jgi:hypothetical protein